MPPTPATAAGTAAPSPAHPPAPPLPPGPLNGVTVLDLAAVGPAARCTRLLADYGATVVKVGAPAGVAGGIVPPAYAYSGHRHLRRINIDLRSDGGRDAFLALVAGADVVIESFRPGVMARLGLGYEDLAAVNPRVILCSTTGFGQHGPRAGWAGHDIDYLAVGGYLATSTPRADGGPPLPGATVADAAAGGMHAALAVVTALVGRASTGRGTHLDVAIADGVLWLESLAIDEHLATGTEPGPGHDLLTGRYACYDTYRAADGGWLAVGAIEPKFFANLCRLLGCPQWADHQFDDDAQAAIRADVAAAFATRGRDDWVALLSGEDTCVAPVLRVAELAGDEHLAARGSFVDAAVVDDGTGRPGPSFRQVGPVLAGMARPEGTVAVRDASVTDATALLAGAGLDEGRIAALLEEGVVS